jgi:hypothetical protein
MRLGNDREEIFLDAYMNPIGDLDSQDYDALVHLGVVSFQGREFFVHRLMTTAESESLRSQEELATSVDTTKIYKKFVLGVKAGTFRSSTRYEEITRLNDKHRALRAMLALSDPRRGKAIPTDRCYTNKLPAHYSNVDLLFYDSVKCLLGTEEVESRGRVTYRAQMIKRLSSSFRTHVDTNVKMQKPERDFFLDTSTRKFSTECTHPYVIPIMQLNANGREFRLHVNCNALECQKMIRLSGLKGIDWCFYKMMPKGGINEFRSAPSGKFTRKNLAGRHQILKMQDFTTAAFGSGGSTRKAPANKASSKPGAFDYANVRYKRSAAAEKPKRCGQNASAAQGTPEALAFNHKNFPSLGSD